MTAQFKTIVDTHKFNKVIAIGIGIVLSVPLLFVSFMMFQNVLTRASGNTPRDVVVTQITETAASISWTTDQKTTGVVEYGTAPNALVFFAPVTGEPSTEHSIELNLLTPRTAHYFQIRINNEVQNNGGVPWTFTTRGSASSTEQVATPSATISKPVTTVSPTVGAGPTVTSGPAAVCNETDCQIIRSKFGTGCKVSDYIRCIQRVTGTPTPTAGPTSASAPTATSVPNAAPTLSNLTVGIGGTHPTLRFEIADSNSDQVRYQIQVDNDQNFNPPLVDYTSGLGGTGNAAFTVGQAVGSGGSYNGYGEVGQALVSGNHYWRVRAIDSKGGSQGTSGWYNANAPFNTN